MKANELMIGDWVHINGYVEPRAHAITAIKPDEFGHYFALLDEDDTWWEIKCLIPIKLTEDILLRNFPDADILAWWKQDWPSKVDYFHIEYSSEEETDFEVAVNINYVHELQHALRLCGIDKTIEL